MALRFIDGFEVRQSAFWTALAYETVSGTITYGSAGRKAGIAAQSTSATLRTKKLVSSDQNTWIIGFAFRKAGASAVSTEIAGITLNNDDGAQCRLHMVAGDSTGSFKWQLRRDTTVIATTAASFAPGEWHYFYLKVNVQDVLDGTYELRHFDRFNNSTTVLSGSSVNLAHQAVDGANSVSFTLAANGVDGVLIDDIIVMDGSGSVNNDFPTKPVVVQGALPTSDGNQTDWTTSSGSTHYVLVDDPAGATALGSDYVQSSDNGDVDLYGFQNFTAIATGTTVVGVQVTAVASMVSSGSKTLRVRVREGADEATGANFTVDAIPAEAFLTLFDQNPTGTPGAWTLADLNAAEFGVEVVS
jgi:hypothetical protein